MNNLYLKRQKILNQILNESDLNKNLSQTQLDLAIKNIDNDLRDFFFLKLKNPHWLKPLIKKGELTMPKAAKTEDGKLLDSNMWSEGIYLSKIAKEKPSEVFGVIKPYLEENLSKNIGVGRFVLMRVFKISENFPDDKNYSLKIGNAYLAYLKHGQNLEAVTNAHEVKDFLKDLARRDYDNLVLQITAELLAMKPSDTENAKFHDFKTRFSDSSNMEDYYCEEILKVVKGSILEKSPFRLFKTLCEILKKAVDGPFLKESNRRLCFNRSAIEDHEQDKYRTAAEFKLISAIRDSAEYIFENDSKNISKVIQILQKKLSDGSEFLIFTRMILHLLHEYPKDRNSLIAKYLTAKNRFDSYEIHHEYYRLLQQEFSNLSKLNQDKIFNFIKKGPPLDKGSLPKDRINLRIKHWQLKKLECIENSLKGEWKGKYEMLSKECNKSSNPDLTSFFESGIVVDRSPLTEEEIARKSLPELIEFLIAWKSEKSFGSANPRGLSDNIEKDFVKNPRKYLDDLLLFKQVTNPTYLKRLIRAFTKYPNKTESDWKVLINLGYWIVEQKDEIESNDLNSYAFDEDSHWGWCKQELAILISESCKSKEQNQVQIPTSLFQDVVQILEKMILDKDVILENWKKGNDDDEDKYYSRAINSCHGEALSALIEFSLWLFRKNEENITSDFLTPVLDQMIVKNYYLEGWAVMGRYLPWIMLINKKWVQKNLDKILPEDNRSKFDSAWLSYVNFTPPFDEVFEVLKKKYLYVLQNHIARKERSNFKLGESIAIFYARKKINLNDEILIELFKKDNLKEGSAMISLIGRLCCNQNDPISKDVIARFKELWDWRVEAKKTNSISEGEYESFKWWYKSGLFDREWAIEQLLESMKKLGKNRRADVFIIEQRLFEDLQNYPKTAWEIIKLILKLEGYFMEVDLDFIRKAFELIEKSDWNDIKKDSYEVKDEFCRRNKLDGNFVSIFR